MIFLEILLLLYFGFVSTYAFTLAVAALFFHMPSVKSALPKRFAVVIPSYKEDSVILEVATDALKQNYPADKYDVVVVADSLHASTVQELEKLPVKLIIASFEKSTKVKALNLAFSTLSNDYDYALILDADNLMSKDLLSGVNNLLARGFQAIQCERTSKNSTTSMSVLDGFSERINNFIYRQGHVAIGLSCSLIGSGMVFDYQLVKSILSGLDSIGGFDRELELELIRRKVRIQYGKGILVFDEKVESTEVFEHQRRRWLSSQFIYLRKYFRSGLSALLHADMNMFNSAILKNIQLPRVVNLGLLGVVTLCAVIFQEAFVSSFYSWILLLTMNIVAIALAIPPRYYNLQTLRSLVLLPKVFVRMFNLLFRLRGANKSFIHTPHGSPKLTPQDKK